MDTVDIKYLFNTQKYVKAESYYNFFHSAPSTAGEIVC